MTMNEVISWVRLDIIWLALLKLQIDNELIKFEYRNPPILLNWPKQTQNSNVDESVKSPHSVTPAKAGVQKLLK